MDVVDTLNTQHRLRKDWASTLAILADRMGAEEQTLHPLFAQLKARAEQNL